jgi:hypothetical protein
MADWPVLVIVTNADYVGAPTPCSRAEGPSLLSVPCFTQKGCLVEYYEYYNIILAAMRANGADAVVILDKRHHQ